MSICEGPRNFGEAENRLSARRDTMMWAHCEFREPAHIVTWKDQGARRFGVTASRAIAQLKGIEVGCSTKELIAHGC